MDEVMKQSAEILSNMFQIQNVFGKKEDVLLIYQCSQTHCWQAICIQTEYKMCTKVYFSPWCL